MWILLAVVLLAIYLGLKLVWNVASAGIHILAVVAAAAVAFHFLRHKVATRGGRNQVV